MKPTPEQIARVCHEANRAWQVLIGEKNPSQPWDDTTEEHRIAAIEGVRATRNGATPEQAHETWSSHKIAEGWRYGPVKDMAAKTHPCLVPYEDLNEDNRRKDELFVAVATALSKEI